MIGRGEVVIRDADAARDGAACAAIYGPFVTGTAVSFEERPPSAEEMARRIATTSKRHPWLVAQDAGEVAGYAYAAPHRERAAYRWACDVAVYVDERNQRRGLGRALYVALFELLKRQGIQVAVAGVTLPNDASVALHERSGFELVGIYRRIGWKSGQWRDVAWWELELMPRSADAPAEPGPPARVGPD
jgi:L-amino acid N-acyltransferase YncA